MAHGIFWLMVRSYHDRTYVCRAHYHRHSLAEKPQHHEPLFFIPPVNIGKHAALLFRQLLPNAQLPF